MIMPFLGPGALLHFNDSHFERIFMFTNTVNPHLQIISEHCNGVLYNASVSINAI